MFFDIFGGTFLPPNKLSIATAGESSSVLILIHVMLILR